MRMGADQTSTAPAANERVVERPDELRAHVVDVRLDQHDLGRGGRVLGTDRLAQRHAQHVRPIGELAGPRAIADRARAHRRQRPEPSTTAARIAAPVGVVSSPSPSGTIGMSPLARSAAVAGAGTGTGPCAVRTTPGPDHRRQRADRGGRQVGDRRRDADDVGDRVVGADLVKGDPIDAGAVQLGLDLGDAREDVGRQRARVGVEPRALEQPLHLRVVAVVVRVRRWRGP